MVVNKKETKEKNKHLIAVYGSLRKGLGNHRLIANAKMIGRFDSEPIYNLWDLGAFPGLKEGGSTSVVMEVYEVNDALLSRVDRLEGYDPYSEPHFYNRVTIDTPFGEAYTYLYVPEKQSNLGLGLVEGGDWTEYKSLKKAINI